MYFIEIFLSYEKYPSFQSGRLLTRIWCITNGVIPCFFLYVTCMNSFLNNLKGKIGTNIKCHKRAHCNRNNMWRCNVAMVMWSRVCKLSLKSRMSISCFREKQFQPCNWRIYRTWVFRREIERLLENSSKYRRYVGVFQRSGQHMARKLKFWKNFWLSFPGFANKGQ